MSSVATAVGMKCKKDRLHTEQQNVKPKNGCVRIPVRPRRARACVRMYMVQTRLERSYSSTQPSVPYRHGSPNFPDFTCFYPIVTFMAFAQETRLLVVSFRIKTLQCQIYGLTFLTSRFHSVFCSQ